MGGGRVDTANVFAAAQGLWSPTILTDGTTGLDPITNVVPSNHIDLRAFLRCSLVVVNAAGAGITFTVEGSILGTVWKPIYYGTGAGGAYVQTALPVAASGTAILLLPDADMFGFVRVNPSAVNAANGSVITAVGQR